MQEHGVNHPGSSQRALEFIFRYRFALHALLFALAFSAPWNYVLHLDSQMGADMSTWLLLASSMARAQWVSFTAATELLLGAGILFTFAGAMLRTWGSAYLGAGVVNDASMHGHSLLANGPFRHLRNPLYLGTMFHTLGLTLLMEPSGAVFALITIGAMQLVLIYTEEHFLTRMRGQDYTAYRQRVPRLMPSLRPRVPAAAFKARWPQAFASEIYFWGVFVSFAALGWRYNATLVLRGVIVSLGLWLIVRAFLPAAKSR